MFKQTTAALFVLVASSGMAFGLSIAPADCTDANGTEYWQALRMGADLVTVEAHHAVGMTEALLVSCQSGQMISASVSPAGLGYFEISEIVKNLYLDEAAYTFADVAEHVSAAGYPATLGIFDTDSCLCDEEALNNMNSLDWIEDNQ